MAQQHGTRRGPTFMLLLALILALMGTTSGATAAGLIRVALVNTPDDLLLELLPDFEAQTGYSVELVYVGEEPYTVARAGQADLVISHYGHPQVEAFVQEGLGLWPHAVFSNQQVLVGPPSDPARIRGLTDGVEALRRIIQTRSIFMVNNTSGIKYIEAMLWEGAGRPELGDWYVDLGLEARPAVEAAAERGAYVFWGFPPFFRTQGQRQLDLVPLVTADPLFQRVMVAVVVNPERVVGVNAEGASALQSYLITPATQAKIKAFRYRGVDFQAWWPAGRHNSAAGRE